MQRIQNVSRLQLAVFAGLMIANLTVSSAATAACMDPSTCYGTDVLFFNSFGEFNSGFGYRALYSNTEGDFNNASGYSALYSNTTGNSNTASGFIALVDNTSGYANSAHGAWALISNTVGIFNTASGSSALYSNTSGNRNTADGVSALYNATGSRNVAVGYEAGYAITSGSNNIMFGAGQKGNAADSGVIRIGKSTFQTRAFIAGIRGVTTGQANAVPVVIDSNGQLGTISSSRRVKEDIQPMGSVSERLLALRPVTFRYKTNYEDGSRPTEFGLIAEEVAEVFPELVVYGEDGTPETVSYHMLSTLLLNEVQKERAVIHDQTATITALQAQIDELNARMSRLEGG